MGNILNQPDTTKMTEAFDFYGNRGAVVSMQGWRISMEDAHVVQTSLSWNSNFSFFGVFDGHGGGSASQYCQQHIVDKLATVFEGKDVSTLTEDQYSHLFKQAYESFDKDMRNDGVNSGTTAICGFVTPSSYIIANLGDSRCVLCRNEKASPLSIDHKPALEGEKSRILKADAFVMNNRVNGDLAVSRSFGDFTFKTCKELPAFSQPVSCEPDVRVIPREAEDNYLIFACDGIWDVFTPDDLVIVLDTLLKSYEKVEEALSKLLDICLERGSKDNMTVLYVPLDKAPQSDKEMIQKRLDNEELERIAREQTEKDEIHTNEE